MHRKRFLPDLSVRASNLQGLRGPQRPRSLLQPGSTTLEWVRKSRPSTIVLGVRQRARAVAMGGAWVESGLLLSHASAFQFPLTRLESSVRVGGYPSIVWQPEIAAPATADWHRETFHGTKDYNKIYLGNLGSGQAPRRAGGGAYNIIEFNSN